MRLRKSSGKVLDLSMEEGSGTTAYDSSRYGNDGALTGCKWVERGLEFNGSSDYVDVDSTANDISVSAGTISLWANAYGSSPEGFVFQSNANTRTYIRRGATAFSVDKGNPQVTINFPNTDEGKLNFLTLTWDNGVMKGYQNDVLIDTKNFLGTSAPSVVRIGQHSSGGAVNSFGGSIDQVRIYNRALTPLEIKHDYDATKYKYL